MNKQICEVPTIGNFGEAEICGEPAIFVYESDKDGAQAICDEHSYNIHPKLLRNINEDAFADPVV